MPAEFHYAGIRSVATDSLNPTRRDLRFTLAETGVAPVWWSQLGFFDAAGLTLPVQIWRERLESAPFFCRITV